MAIQLLLKVDTQTGVYLAAPLQADDIATVHHSFTNSTEETVAHALGDFPNVRIIQGTGPYYDMPPTAIRVVEYGAGFVRVAFNGARSGRVILRP